MIAFFDTNIFIDVLKGLLPQSTYNQWREEYVIRMCPVVYQELIRCVKSESLKEKIEAATEKFILFPPPTNEMWITAGEMAGKVAGTYDERALERIQNDLLIALTARQNGAVLITQDLFFKNIQKYIEFRLRIHTKHSFTGEKSAIDIR